jgi:hypothetical protein
VGIVIHSSGGDIFIVQAVFCFLDADLTGQNITGIVNLIFGMVKGQEET